ncbi:MAG: GGDEF domain-containing protein [Pseudomonadota bacterium]|nr:GGDEF domain-containing protein [Pseudomonadota bacterium]
MALIPTDDPALATRVKRQLMGFMSYMMFVVPMIYAVHSGWLRLGYGGLAWLVVVAFTINVGFLFAIRSGYTRRFADPSLMVLQVGIACATALVIGYYLDQARIITVMLFFTAFFFGIFSFSRRQYLGLTIVAVVGYALMWLLKISANHIDANALHLELLHFMMLVIVLLWMSLLGSYIAQLRESLARKKDALATALERLKELSSHDELTGLHNRRHLMGVLDQQQERALRHDEPFALCLLDLDNFKRINDTHGHGVGDEVLRGFSERIRAHMRGMDIIARGDNSGSIDSSFGRYGGEEFLLVLPYAEDASARACVERLRKAINASPFPTSAGELAITFSAGVAHYCKGETIAAMLDRADAALYHAKAEGRDRVEIAGTMQPART